MLAGSLACRLGPRGAEAVAPTDARRETPRETDGEVVVPFDRASTDCPAALELAGTWRFTTVPWTPVVDAALDRPGELRDFHLVVERQGCSLAVTVTQLGTAAKAFGQSERSAAAVKVDVGAGRQVVVVVELTTQSEGHEMAFVFEVDDARLVGWFERRDGVGWIDGVREEPGKRSTRIIPRGIATQPCPVQCRTLCVDDPIENRETCIAQCDGDADPSVATRACLPGPVGSGR